MKMKAIQYLFLLVILSVSCNLHAQETTEETEPIEPSMEMTYLKDSHGKINLRVNLVNYVNRQPVPLVGLKVVFHAGEDSLVNLGEVVTDADGHAVMKMDNINNLPAGPDGIRYYAEYEGQDDILPADYEIFIIDANLEMELSLVDSVKTVSLKAWSLVDGEKLPVADEDVYVYIGRSFRDLPIGEDFLDENGEIIFEVPDDIPGNPEGIIEMIARFNDHYLFGTVENRQEIKWGVPTYYDTVAAERTLWTQIAPLWMIITLTILLVGVWSHYTYVVISIIRVKRLGKKEKQSELV